jgi:hypothetical protein
MPQTSWPVTCPIEFDVAVYDGRPKADDADGQNDTRQTPQTTHADLKIAFRLHH